MKENKEGKKQKGKKNKRRWSWKKERVKEKI